MPNRILRPWVDSEAVNSLSDAAEVFFVRLIQCADDYGRFYGTPMLLKSYLYPLKDKRVADITRWIAECVKAGLIADYEVSGKRYLEILKFNQRTRAMGSKFPARPSSESQSNDSQMTVKCQSNDRQMTARDERRETETNIPLAGDYPPAHTEDPYPHSVDEVIALSKLPWCAMRCTKEQAEAYFTDRLAKDWTPYGQDRMKSKVQICADLKKWLMRDQNKTNGKQNGNNNGKRDVRVISNDPAKFDPADDGSNI